MSLSLGKEVFYFPSKATRSQANEEELTEGSFYLRESCFFPDSGAGVTLVFGSVINDQCTCVWVPREAFMLCGSLGGLE